MNSTLLQTLQFQIESYKAGSTKDTRKSLSAHWVMEDGKLICKWVMQ